jgi:hypothetical protein
MGSDELEVLLEFWGVRQSAQRLQSLAVGIRAYHSSLLTWAVLARMDALNRERARLQAELVRRRARSKVSEPMLRQLRGPPLEVDRQHVLEHCVATWADGSRCLDALCKRMGTAYLDVLQPTLGDAGSKKRTEKEKAIPFPSDGWVRGSRDGFPMLRETGKTLAAEGIAFLDASRAFEDTEEELYYDACHFGPRGCEILCGLGGAGVPREVAEAVASATRAPARRGAGTRPTPRARTAPVPRATRDRAPRRKAARRCAPERRSPRT